MSLPTKNQLKRMMPTISATKRKQSLPEMHYLEPALASSAVDNISTISSASSTHHDATNDPISSPRSYGQGIVPFTAGILASLCNYEDIWEHMCSFLSGDALCCLAQVRFFEKPTRQTPAFMCLSGLNNDAELVPWNDADNILSANYIWRPLCYVRNMCAIISADIVFQQLKYPIYSRNFQMGGPARPSTPVPFPHDDPREPALSSITLPSGQRFNPKVYGAPVYSLPNPNYYDYIHRYSAFILEYAST
jgi:hypothetical protein